jgi:hypothetical protein
MARADREDDRLVEDEQRLDAGRPPASELSVASDTRPRSPARTWRASSTPLPSTSRARVA